MAVLMFWNIGQCEVAEIIGSLCHEYRVDVLLLAEAVSRGVDVLQYLNTGDSATFWELSTSCPSRVRLFTRYPQSSISPVFDDGRVSIRNLHPPVGAEVLIVAAHLPSKLRSDAHDQYYRIRRLREDIEDAEQLVGHRNSIVIGDLNANPFEDPMIAADGLHGVMDKKVARRTPRTVQGRSWDFFYNPMWSRLGDESKGPPGTYYYARGDLVSYFWNTFDQVLLRPSLLPYYNEESLTIISHSEGREILTPNRAGLGSPDHLPIVVKLSIEMEQGNG
jgi:Endonuclease/Exonuclease/phosphatase family